MARVGILGGTFDPPHRAHVAMVQAALQRIPLEKILVMPAPNPPHKRAGAPTPYPLRKEMTRIAFAGLDGVEVSDMEEFRRGPSYTVDLLRHYKATSDDDLHLILGADSVADLPAWKDPKDILELATIVVFSRTGCASAVPIDGPVSVIFFEDPVIDISSTEVRDVYRKGGDARDDLPAGVHQFILDNSIYS